MSLSPVNVPEGDEPPKFTFDVLLKRDKKKQIPKDEFRRLYISLQCILFPAPPEEDPAAAPDYTQADGDYTQAIEPYIEEVCSIWNVSKEYLLLRMTGKKPLAPANIPVLKKATDGLLEDPETASIEDRLAKFLQLPAEARRSLVAATPVYPAIDPTKKYALVAKPSDIAWDCPALPVDDALSLQWHLWLGARAKRMVKPPAFVIAGAVRNWFGPSRITPSHPLETLRAVVTGRAAVGKTTVAEHIAKEFGVALLSIDRIVGSNAQCKALLQNGDDVPPSLVSETLRRAISTREIEHSGYVIDDSPADFSFSALPTELQPNVVVDLCCADAPLQRRIAMMQVDCVSGRIMSDDDFLPKPSKKKRRRPTEDGNPAAAGDEEVDSAEREENQIDGDAAQGDEEGEDDAETADEEETPPEDQDGNEGEEPRPKVWVSMLPEARSYVSDMSVSGEECRPPEPAAVSRLEPRLLGTAQVVSLDTNTSRANVLRIVSRRLADFRKVMRATVDELTDEQDALPPQQAVAYSVRVDLVEFVDKQRLVRVSSEGDATDTATVAAYFGGRKFLFVSEANRNLFVQCPRRYVRDLPAPRQKRTLMFGVIGVVAAGPPEQRVLDYFSCFSTIPGPRFVEERITIPFSRVQELVVEELSHPSDVSGLVVVFSTVAELNRAAPYLDFVIDLSLPSTATEAELGDAAAEAAGEGDTQPSEQISAVVPVFASAVAADPFYPPFELMEGGAGDPEEYTKELGPFGMFDAVELGKTGRLLVGKSSLAVRFAGEIFTFFDEANSQAFLKDPFLLVEKALGEFRKAEVRRSARVAVLGPRRSGCSRLSDALAKQLSTPVIQANRQWVDAEIQAGSDVGLHLSQVMFAHTTEQRLQAAAKEAGKVRRKALLLKKKEDAAAAKAAGKKPAAIAAGEDEAAEDEADGGAAAGEEQPEEEDDVPAEDTSEEERAKIAAEQLLGKLVAAACSFCESSHGGWVLVSFEADLGASFVEQLTSAQIRTCPDIVVTLSSTDDEEWLLKQIVQIVERPAKPEAPSSGEEPDGGAGSGQEAEEEEEEFDPEAAAREILSASAAQRDALADVLVAAGSVKVDIRPSYLPQVVVSMAMAVIRSKVLSALALSTDVARAVQPAPRSCLTPVPVVPRLLVHNNSRVAKTLAKKLGCKCISGQSLLADPYYLRSEVLQSLQRGELLGRDAWLSLLDRALCEYESVFAGYVIDGFEMAIAEDADRFCIQRVFCYDDEKAANAYKNSYYPSFAVRASKSSRSIWSLRHEAAVVAQRTVSAIQQQRDSPQLFRCMDCPIKTGTFEGRMGAAAKYCVISLVDSGMLVDCAADVDRTCFVCYADRFYAASSPALAERFMLQPAHYVSQIRLPKDLPQRVDCVEPGQVVALSGFSPISLKRPATLEFAALYRSKVFVFCSLSEREEFLKQPWKFAEKEISEKLRTSTGISAEAARGGSAGLLLGNLSAVGYLEASGLAQATNEALTAFSKRFKALGGLKHPRMSVEETAATWISLYLRIIASRDDPKRRVQFERSTRKLAQLEACSSLQPEAASDASDRKAVFARSLQESPETYYAID